MTSQVIEKALDKLVEKEIEKEFKGASILDYDSISMDSRESIVDLAYTLPEGKISIAEVLQCLLNYVKNKRREVVRAEIEDEALKALTEIIIKEMPKRREK